jgi:copper chaperone CopZ
MTNKITKNNRNWVAGIFAAIGASICCITPVLALLGGASGLATSFSWIEPYRLYFISVTILIFGYAWYQKLKPQKQVDCNCETDNKKSLWQTKLFLGIVTIVAGCIIAFPYYAKAFYPKPQEAKVVVVDKTNIHQAVFKIKGMTCESCSQHVNSEISKVKGIVAFQTSCENANSIVKFDNSKTSIDSIAAAINSTGYKVVSQTLTAN